MTAPAARSPRALPAALAIIGVLLVVAVLFAGFSGDDSEPPYAYSDLLADAAAGQVQSIEQEGTVLYVSFVDALPLTSYVASDSINVYSEVCAAMGSQIGPDCAIYFVVTPSDQADKWVALLISALLPVLLIGAFFLFMMRQAQKTQNL